MAHYAFLDNNNVVTEVITGKNEFEDGIDWEQHYGEFRNQTCKRTSYNTVGGIHMLGGTPFRKNAAAIGYVYDESRDAFYLPQPFPSWILNETTCQWESPKPYPGDAENFYVWDESTQEWVQNQGVN